MASLKFPKRASKSTSFLQIFMMLGLMVACTALDPQVKGTTPVSHELFDSLLKKHVREDGLVNYQLLRRDSANLSRYLSILTTNPPNDDHWSEDEKLAYWINLYNAFTLKLVLKHYPVESIKDIGSKIQLPFVNTPWDIKFIELGGQKYDLNNVEHNIIRKTFEEPRIHFAVNCASMSCPKLRREAYVAERLDQQLEEQAVEFLNDPSRNLINSEQAAVSKIFLWYGGDFKKQSSLREFINQYVPTSLGESRKISYMDYDWSLNDTSK